MSMFSVLGALAARRRSPSAAPGARNRNEAVASKVPGFSPRDKKRSAGTKAGFGRKGRSLASSSSPTAARPARASRQSRPASGGIRGFVSSLMSRLRRA